MSKTTRKTRTRSTSAKRRALRDALDTLHKSLDDAYWAAGEMTSKDRIAGVMRLVYDVLSELNHLELEGRTERFREIKAEINEALKHVKKLKEDIDKLIQAVKVATTVAKHVDQFVKAAAAAAA